MCVPTVSAMSATIDDVASLAGVSTATVSRALRGLPNVAEATRAKVGRAATALDYVVDPAASALAAGSTGMVGLVVPTIGRWAHAHLVEVVQDHMAEAGFDLLPVIMTSPAARGLLLERHQFWRRVDGMMVVDVALDPTGIARLRQDRPLVAVGLRANDVDTIVSDEAAGIAAATTHLLSLGHRRIAFIGGSDEDIRLVAPTARRDGFLSSLREAGIADPQRWIVESQVSATGGAAAMSLLLDEPVVPTAVLVMSDEMALGVMEVARAAGLTLPDDLSVVGVDDQPVAQYIGLSTVRRDVTAIATMAASWLVARLTAGDQPPPRHRVVATSLVLRGSTAPPR